MYSITLEQSCQLFSKVSFDLTLKILPQLEVYLFWQYGSTLIYRYGFIEIANKYYTNYYRINYFNIIIE